MHVSSASEHEFCLESDASAAADTPSFGSSRMLSKDAKSMEQCPAPKSFKGVIVSSTRGGGLY
jgi:hypothetical protein